MKALLFALISMVAVSALADSQFLDRERLNQCGGSVELRRAGNGDLALKFEGRIDRNFCDRLRFVDVSSGRVIRSYNFEGSSYTLSQSMRSSLSSDCSVEFQMLSPRGRVVERKQVTLGWWCAAAPVIRHNPGAGRGGGYTTYEWSQNNNCKIMVNGRYTGNNTPEHLEEYYCGRRPYRRY